MRSLLMAGLMVAAVGIPLNLSAGEKPVSSEKQPTEFLVFVGTYTGASSEGIYSFRFSAEREVTTEPILAVKTESPSFLAIHPNGKYLYAVNETAKIGETPGGGITAFEIDRESGKLKELNQQSTQGAAPCHLVVDRTGKNVLVANYTGGSVICFPLKEDGSLEPASSFIQHRGSSVDPARQEAPHAHSINLSPDNRFAFVADLGLDKIFVYEFDSKTGKLKPHDPPSAAVAPGSGPRHFAFHPTGKMAFVINEMKLTVTAFDYQADKGVLTPMQTISTLPEGTENAGNLSTAEVAVHPNGRFLYGSNRGHDTIAVFEIDQTTKELRRVENESTQGRTPRNFAIDPTGQYLFAENQGSGTIVLFKINSSTGELESADKTIEVPTPVCVKFLPLK